MQKLRVALLAGIAAATMLAAVPAGAVIVVDGTRYDLPDTAKPEVVRALDAIAFAMGMQRRGQTAANITFWNITSRWEYTAVGIFDGQPVDSVTVGFDYNFPAVRIDVTRGGQRTIEVAKMDVVWEETTPGVYAGAQRTDATESMSRQWHMWLLPTAVTVAGSMASDKVTITNARGDIQVTLPNGTPMNVRVDGFKRPVGLEVTIGGKVHTVEFSGFTNDKMDNHVFFPRRIIHKVDGQIVDDLTVREHWAEPYIIFPSPSEVA